jgi:DNA helicase II / ATP-dependent DNA helicase PcrA
VTIRPEERRHFELFHQPTARVYSAVLPGEIVRKCVEATTTGVIDPVELLGIDHLVVDEYQDLNPTDLEFVDQLAGGGVRLFVAGDDDQSIYSFRHASPLGIQRFTEKYPKAAAHALRHCFRCTPDVLQAATHMILNNASPNRIAKTLVSLYEHANPPNRGVVHRWRFMNANQEAGAVANSCAALIQAGLQPREILILLANRRVLWPGLQEALTQEGLPFDPPREEGFSDSKVGRLVLSLCRIICSRDEDGNSEDLVAHRTLFGLRRGVGVGTCNHIRAAVIATQNQSFRGLFYGDLPDGVLGPRAITALNHARGICRTIANWQPTDTLAQHRNQIADLTRSTLDEAAAREWMSFSEPLPPEMRMTELRDYVWVDNAQQRADVLGAVRRRLELPEEEGIAVGGNSVT